MATQVSTTVGEAIADIVSGSTLAVGGFGLCGIPDKLIEAVAESGATDLEVYSNNCGVDDHGLGILLSLGRIRRVTASYVGENRVGGPGFPALLSHHRTCGPRIRRFAESVKPGPGRVKEDQA
jgi:acyl CoA:acetate/3-ketoacid CoA transferase alpha subunit